MGNILFNITNIINTCIKDCTENSIDYYTDYDYEHERFIYDPIEQRYISIYKKKLYTIDEIPEHTSSSSPSKTRSSSSRSSFSSNSPYSPHSPHSTRNPHNPHNPHSPQYRNNYDDMYFIQK